MRANIAFVSICLIVFCGCVKKREIASNANKLDLLDHDNFDMTRLFDFTTCLKNDSQSLPQSVAQSLTETGFSDLLARAAGHEEDCSPEKIHVGEAKKQLPETLSIASLSVVTDEPEGSVGIVRTLEGGVFQVKISDESKVKSVVASLKHSANTNYIFDLKSIKFEEEHLDRWKSHDVDVQGNKLHIGNMIFRKKTFFWSSGDGERGKWIINHDFDCVSAFFSVNDKTTFQDLNFPAEKIVTDAENLAALKEPKPGANPSEIFGGLDSAAKDEYIKEAKKQAQSRVGFSVALAVRRFYNSMLKTFPDGLIMTNNPESTDRISEERAHLYEKFGFGKNGRHGQFGVVRGGKLVPLTNKEVFYILAFAKAKRSNQ